jgi:phosphoglucosamine mutase
MSLGRAAAAAVAAERPGVLIVRDTRESGPMLEAALAAGVAAAGGDALMAGVLPTPAAAVLARRHGLELAAVVSASHNPFGDNGIKFFSRDGYKIDDETEARIEALLEEPPPAGATRFGRVRELSGGLGDYLRALEEAFPLDLSGSRVMLDCANGATYAAAPAIFERLGAEVETIAAEPDGRNINEGCGSTHLEYLAQRIADSEAAIGFAFDGDGDRVLAVDGSGTVHDGDELIALIAEHLVERDALGGGVAVTVMTNFGFHRAMEEAGVEVATTPVGDRHVLDQLRERGWKLGGEQSGHIIAMDYAPTGDGIGAALLTMQALAGGNLGATSAMQKLPQTLVNVRVSDLDAVSGATRVWEAAEAESEALAGRGRVLVRPSGTEPLVRVMVEAPEAAEAQGVAERLADLVRRELS